MTVCNDNAEFLRVFVRDLEYAVHVRIAEQFNESGTLRRNEANLDRRRARINVGEFEAKEITRAPIPGDRATVIEIFQRSVDFANPSQG